MCIKVPEDSDGGTLAVVIPAFNEAERIGITVESVLTYLSRHGYSSELVVVDDGSTDSTVRVVKDTYSVYRGPVATKLVRLGNRHGKGWAIRTGLMSSRAVIGVLYDADGSTPIAELPRIVGPIASGICDVVIGERSTTVNRNAKRQSLRRRVASRLFNLLVRQVTTLPYTDTQCGFKALRMSVCRPLLQTAMTKGYCFDVEILVLAQCAKLRICNAIVQWDDQPGSKVRLLVDSFQMIQELLSIRRRAKNGMYERGICASVETARRS